MRPNIDPVRWRQTRDLFSDPVRAERQNRAIDEIAMMTGVSRTTLVTITIGFDLLRAFSVLKV